MPFNNPLGNVIINGGAVILMPSLKSLTTICTQNRYRIGKVQN